MEEKKKRNQIIKISVFITSIFVILLSVSYAFINLTLQGEKKQVLTAGNLSLELKEDENVINISAALPMYDEVGMIQTPFTFRIINNTGTTTAYTLKLVDITTGDKLDTGIVKYGLTKDGVTTKVLLSALADGVIDSGTIGTDTIEYELRLWIDSSVTDNTSIKDKSLSYKLELTTEQVSTEEIVYFIYNENTPVLESASNSMNSYSKISHSVLTEEDTIGKTVTGTFLDGTTQQLEVTTNRITRYEADGKNYGFAILPYLVVILEDIPEDNSFGLPALTPGMWPLSFSFFKELGISEITSDIIIPQQKISTVTFAGRNLKVNETSDGMFNYSSEGCIMDLTTKQQSCPADPTNGIYTMDDDDGPSYYYRGDVNNLVQFGTYTKDYYVYRYIDGETVFDFASLEACKYYNSSCSESNKVLKYAASDNVPMYWKIVRINGDGTIRMIYAGTEIDAQGQELGIGLSRYNEEYTDPKYAGYTYDRDTTEVDSDAKTEIDAWYANNIEGTTYDDYIVEGKFCSDSSDYGEVTEISSGNIYNAFGSVKRTIPFTFGIEQDSNPIFKCPTTDKTYGGSYTLKVGLMNLDEMVAAGGQLTENSTNYLYDTEGFWSLTPAYFFNGRILVGSSIVGYSYIDNVDANFSSLRPVINLGADVVFTTGTDGSTLTPYTLSN